MGSIEWEMIAVMGFALAILLGSILLFRARRSLHTVTMLVAGILQVLGVTGMIGGQFLLRNTLGPMGLGGSYPYQIYRVVSQVSGLVFIGGLVLFAWGFVRFGLRQVAVERRAEELEGMVRGLSERMKEDA